MTQDILFAVRFLRKNPVWTIVAVTTLAVAIGGTSLVVGTVDQTFWKPLNFPESRRLVTLYENRGEEFQTLSYPDFVEYRSQAGESLQLAALSRIRVSLAIEGGEPFEAFGELVSGDYFSVLGTRPALGRWLNPEDDRVSDGDAVVVLSHRLWQNGFGADSEVIGRRILLERESYAVVGVAPADFQDPAWDPVFWVPLATQPLVMPIPGVDLLQAREVPWLQIIGRLHDGVEPEEAQAQLRLITQQRELRNPAEEPWRLSVFPATYLRFWPAYRPRLASLLGILAAMAASILLIACTNLTALLLARSRERSRELAVRRALGARPFHLARRVGAEIVLVTAMGGLLGALILIWASPFVRAFPLPIPFAIELNVDHRTAALSLATTFVAAGFLSAALALGSGRLPPRGARQADLRPGGSRSRLLRVSVVAQVAATSVLLTGAGLLLRSAIGLQAVPPGFEPNRGLMAHVTLPLGVYDAERTADFQRTLLEALRGKPSIESSSLAAIAVLGPIRATSEVLIAGSTVVGADEALRVRYNAISPGYFETLGIGLRKGRDFRQQDGREGPLVAIVNQTVASRFWDGVALGKPIRARSDESWRTVVGVVEDVKYNDLAEAPQPFMYLPLAQQYSPDFYIHLRSVAEDPASALSVLKDSVRGLDPHVPLSDAKSLSEQLDGALAASRATAGMASLLASIAALLALVGIYGVVSHSVNQRAREISIRSALGAAPGQLRTEVLTEGMSLTGIGLALGLATGLVLSGFLGAFLHGVAARDPATLLAVLVFVVLVSLAACWIPARRAAQLEPAQSLRVD